MDLLRLCNIGKRFGQGDASFWALRGVNLSFPSSGLYAIKGKSGSGKSTLLNLIAALLPPDEGQIFFEGKDIGKLKGNKLSDFHLHEISNVFQHYNLIPKMSALHNAALPLLMAGERKGRAYKKARRLFADFKMSALADKNIDHLSGGEKQRVAIIRSLVNDPKMILADEPTGALDEQSSFEVMNMLKAISRQVLVIMVSHNEELIETFADQVIEVRDGSVSSPLLIKDNEIVEFSNKKHEHGDGWTGFFTRRHLKQNGAKNFVCLLSSFIGFSACLLGMGFYEGSAASIEKQGNRSLEYLSASISEKKYLEIADSPLQLVQQVRPLFANATDAIGGIKSATLENDYSYFFPSYCAYTFEGEEREPTNFRPVYDLSFANGDPSYLERGHLPPQNELGKVLVNEEFAALFPYDVLGKAIQGERSFELTLDGVKDEVTYPFFFQIVGIVKEFSFLNSPKVYYSYLGMKEKMKTLALPKISESLERSYNVDSIMPLLSDDHPATNYDYLLFIKKAKDGPELEKRIEELSISSFLSIDSSTYSIKNAFKELCSSFNVSLVIFLIIAIAGIGLIIAMTSYSNFLSHKKETAILFVLGGRNNGISNIFINESVGVAFLSSVLSLICCRQLAGWLNVLIAEKFSLEDLIQIPMESFFGYPYALPFLLIFFSMLIVFLASSLSLSALKKMPLAEELKDE